LGGQGYKKAFTSGVLHVFRKLLERTAHVEELRLFKAAVISSAARVCGEKQLDKKTYGKSDPLVESEGERC